MTQLQKSVGRRLSRRDAIALIGSTGAGLAAVLREEIGLASQAPQRGGRGTVAAPPASNVAKSMVIDGSRVFYEDRGQGIPIVLSAGGRNRMETLRPLAEKLLAMHKYRVISWDRANLGRSDIVLKGARDLDLWTDQLSELVLRLNARPAWFVGASSGSRVSYTMALRYTDCVRGVFTFLTTGGGTIGESLGVQYYGDYADLAEKEGMAAVVKTPYWAELIALNPGNRQRLLAMDPRDFVRVMRRWQKAMRSNPDPMIGVTADDLRQLKANGTPIGIVRGCEAEAAHRRDRSELYAQLTGATLVPEPAGYCEEYATTGLSDLKLRPEVPESSPFRGYEMISSVPGLIDDFITKTEARLK